MELHESLVAIATRRTVRKNLLATLAAERAFAFPTPPLYGCPTRKKTQHMKNSEKRNLLKWNTILWLVAMALPAVFSFAFASTTFPWQIIVPLLLVGCLFASNKMLAQAIGQSTDDANPKSPNA